MSELNHDEDAVGGIDLFRLLKVYGRRVLLTTVGVTGVVAVLGAVYLLWGQSVRRTAVLEFRPTFIGADRGEYPNGLPFAVSDVTAPQVADLVYASNKVEDYCSREDFRGGFFAEQRSAQSALLDAEYEARLSEPRLSAVERQALMAEYDAKRLAMPLQFRLVFVRAGACSAIPDVLTAKIMTDLLTTWASESESRRGVLKMRVGVLTPASLDVGVGREGARLLRADLVRTALERIIANVDAVIELPGAVLVRPADGLTFAELRNRLADLSRSKLDPLAITAGRSMVRDSLAWVNETVVTNEREQKEAEGRASVYENALRQYSGGSSATQANQALAPAPGNASSDVQTLSPQIDSTFIDRIIEMSTANAEFRKELTLEMVDARVESIRVAARASYYRRLLQSLSQRDQPLITTADIDAGLDQIIDEAKALTTQFNKLYAEYSRVALRAAAGMYRVEKPVTMQVLRAFTPRRYMMLVFGTFVATLMLTFGYCVLRDRMKAQIG